MISVNIIIIIITSIIIIIYVKNVSKKNRYTNHRQWEMIPGPCWVLAFETTPWCRSKGETSGWLINP